ncbi:hypothetical protein [Metallosphaera javensis (ex Sakai et al. 2022)]|uniref:hypothetical protein n=1 Tax=Metallosphaera javensis (ex Sakai et al. 2022) TaxID=2775498 RepID=UPI002585D23D|nr:MAG: hypothetical protein MjAS7_1624 [Metallosphaera javensis (ex Sakai et al. 2022)]
MDTIDNCQIECKFRKKKKDQLEDRFYIISYKLKSIEISCKLMNLVCRKEFEPSCYQIKINDSWNTGECVIAQPKKEYREIYCFKFSENSYFIIVAQDIDNERYVITFFPFDIYKASEFRKLKRKCDDKYVEINKIFNSF